MHPLVTFLAVSVVMVIITLKPTLTQAKGTGGIKLLCELATSKGSFTNKLQSITWEDPGQTMYVCLLDTCVFINSSTLTLEGGAVVSQDTTWVMSEERREIAAQKSSGPISGIYFFLVKADAKGAPDGERQWEDLFLMESAMWMEGRWTVDSGIKPMALIHGPVRKDGELPYMFAIEWDTTTKHFIFFSFTLLPADEDYRINVAQKGKHYYATWAPGLLNTLRLVPQPMGVPAQNAFAFLPRGTWAEVGGQGAVFLFDDDKGCVYAVQGWPKGLNLAALYDEDNHRSLDFAVKATPYERFFNCRACESCTVNSALNDSRCQVIGGEEEGGGVIPRSGLVVALGVTLALLALLLALMVFCACKGAKGLVMKNSFKRSAKSGRSGRGNRTSTEGSSRSQSSKLKVSSQAATISSPKSKVSRNLSTSGVSR